MTDRLSYEEEPVLDTYEDAMMAYAKERKMRMALETRLYGMTYDVIPFMATMDMMVKALIEGDSSGMAAHVRTLFEWRPDLEIHTFLQMSQPAGVEAVEAKERLFEAIKSSGEIQERDMIQVRDLCQHHAKKVYDEWDQLAAKHEGLASRARSKEIALRHLKSMMLEQVAKKA